MRSLESILSSRMIMNQPYYSANSLYCWSCNSLTQFCDDPFTGKAKEHPNALVECKKSPVSSRREPNRAVCIKVITIEPGLNTSVVQRNCHWEDANVSKNSCHSQMSSTSAIPIKYCETCATDGCNGGLQMKAGTILLVLSVFWNVLRLY